MQMVEDFVEFDVVAVFPRSARAGEGRALGREIGHIVFLGAHQNGDQWLLAGHRPDRVCQLKDCGHREKRIQNEDAMQALLYSKVQGHLYQTRRGCLGVFVCGVWLS